MLPKYGSTDVGHGFKGMYHCVLYNTVLLKAIKKVESKNI